MGRVVTVKRSDFVREAPEDNDEEFVPEDELDDSSEVTFCEEDLDYDETLVREVVKHLRDEGVCFPTASAFHVGVRYETEEYVDPYTGEHSHSSFSLDGLTPSEEEEVFDAVKKW